MLVGSRVWSVISVLFSVRKPAARRVVPLAGFHEMPTFGLTSSSSSISALSPSMKSALTPAMSVTLSEGLM